MKLSASIWACIIVLFIAGWRSIQLYRSSTAVLSPNASVDATTLQSEIHPPRRYRKDIDEDDIMNEKPAKLFYFVQISDLHLSKFRSHGYTNHFLHFLQSILPTINPEFVVVTGDLTDAKDAKAIKTGQYKEEWEMYKEAVQQGSLGIPWYDMKGNHDSFNLASNNASTNLYGDYGKSADLLENEGIYSWDIIKPFGKYRFVVADATPKRGPARPLNFFGYLTSTAMDKLEEAILTPELYNHTFMFSHYPTTTMVFGETAQGHSYKDLSHRLSVYFCGHLHRLVAGLGDALKRYNYGTDHLELELADMKDHGAFRIVAVDHDMISFIDAELPVDQIQDDDRVLQLPADKRVPWPKPVPMAPVILITNPKDARYLLADKEPYHLPKRSTHIRFLVFSNADPSQLRVRIMVDEKRHPFPAKFVGTKELPLWISEWEPNDFDDMESHMIRIEATFGDLTGEATTMFRMDSMRLSIAGGFGEWLIGAHMSYLLRTLSLIGIFIMVLLILGPPLYRDIWNKDQGRIAHILLCKIHEIDQYPTCGPFDFVQRQVLLWLLRFMQLGHDQPAIWYTTFYYLMILLMLPWFQAEFIPSGTTDAERYGLFYMWGLAFGKEWIPLADSWKYAFTQLFFDLGIFLMLFAWRATEAVDIHCRGSSKGRQQKRQLNEHAWFKGLEVLYWLWRMSQLVTLGSFYGGLYPTLIMNVWTWWLLFVGAMLLQGKGGLFFKKRQRIPIVVPGCAGCSRDAS